MGVGRDSAKVENACVCVLGEEIEDHMEQRDKMIGRDRVGGISLEAVWNSLPLEYSVFQSLERNPRLLSLITCLLLVSIYENHWPCMFHPPYTLGP